ncbi:unnamed protein product [Soboliphyme baturini]|uniref:MBF1 domain-containing protein n=1 Tax=Soboliphyme baturini TaxID=241478 RepID=A0A183IWB6_9BILA|nr:unnamed protein product [Soboliphyme baturini]
MSRLWVKTDSGHLMKLNDAQKSAFTSVGTSTGKHVQPGDSRLRKVSSRSRAGRLVTTRTACREVTEEARIVGSDFKPHM